MNLKKHAKPNAEIPTSSLADIVFLLLIFFLVTTSMNPAKGIGMTLPPPGEQVEIRQENVLNIFVNPEGAILVAGEITDLRDVRQKVYEARMEFKRRRGEDDEIIVSLLAHTEAEYKHMIDVLDEIKQAEATKISIATPHF
ncbi:MAG TPA: biopolymer transporter ExbD [candidate division Zixibacteria bacterium]|nr:biopolymer transporter ExbD [candidate division Zixibacteria bacterium]